MNDHLEFETSSQAGVIVSGSEEEGQEDFDLVEYARFYGLCEDFTKFNALGNFKSHLQPVDIIQDLEDPISTGSAQFLDETDLKERINVDRDAAGYLKWVSQLQQERPSEEELFQLEQNRVLWHKVEIPLLKTDHELDMYAFYRSQRSDELPNYQIPLEQLNDEADDGMAWPSSCNGLPARYDEELAAEKISVTRDILLQLQSNIKDGFTAEDEQSIITAALPDRTSKELLQPLTPPLLPLSPQQEPCIPSSPVCHFQLLSESTNTTAAENEALEQALFQEEKIIPQGRSIVSDHALSDDYDVGQVYSPLHSIADTPSSLPVKRMRREDLKIDGPMTPPMNFESPGKRAKTVSFKESLEQYVPEAHSKCMAEEDTYIMAEVEAETFFNDTIRPFAEEAERKIQQEQLKLDGNMQRVDVPVLDFSMPESPWMEFARRKDMRPGRHKTNVISQQELLSMIKHEHFRNEKPWPGVSKLERQLSWSPFPSQLAKVVNEDRVQDDGTVANVLDELTIGEIIDSASLTWKPEGLLILDESEDDDELEDGIFLEDRQDMQSLLKKRRFEINDEMQAPRKLTFQQTSAQEPEGLHQEGEKEPLHLPCPGDAEGSWKPHDSGLMFGGMFSAATALQNYMSLQGCVAKPSAVESDAVKKLAPPPKPLTHAMASEPMKQTAPLETQPFQSSLIPVPNLPALTTPTSFIINSEVLNQRHLFRRLEQLSPSANFIERDFTVQVPNSQSGNEADIILSPSTGLIWTTLQKIKQRPLPGQISRHAVKDRIQAVASRYERLIVLVSEGSVAAPTPRISGLRVSTLDPGVIAEHSIHQLDERDALAFADLAAFAASLEDEVVVSYIPGGQETLARWIVGLMARFAAPQERCQLLRDETLWERFLRAAGMNAYAAQVVLAELKEPEGGMVADERAGRSSGLAAFVKMGREERIRRFEMVLGGRKILEEVGRVFDSRWVSAAGG